MHVRFEDTGWGVLSPPAPYWQHPSLWSSFFTRGPTTVAVLLLVVLGLVAHMRIPLMTLVLGIFLIAAYR